MLTLAVLPDNSYEKILQIAIVTSFYEVRGGVHNAHRHPMAEYGPSGLPAVLVGNVFPRPGPYARKSPVLRLARRRAFLVVVRVQPRDTAIMAQPSMGNLMGNRAVGILRRGIVKDARL